MKKSAFLAICLLCAFAGLGLGAQIKDDREKMDIFRLSGDTVPEFYHLRFVPNFNGTNSTFSGVTTIRIVATSNTKVITLNLKELNVTNVTVTDVKSQRNIAVKDLVYDAKNEQFSIVTQNAIASKRSIMVVISYNAKIRTDLSGLYLSSYEEGNTTK